MHFTIHTTRKLLKTMPAGAGAAHLCSRADEVERGSRPGWRL